MILRLLAAGKRDGREWNARQPESLNLMSRSVPICRLAQTLNVILFEITTSYSILFRSVEAALSLRLQIALVKIDAPAFGPIYSW